MARNSDKNRAPASKGAASKRAAPDREVLAHIAALGLKSVDEYQRWCVEHGFRRSLQKHSTVRARERQFARNLVADRRRARSRHESRQTGPLLADICRGRVRVQDIAQPYLRRFCGFVQSAEDGRHEPRIDRAVLGQLVEHLQSGRCRLLQPARVAATRGEREGGSFLEGLALLSTVRSQWCRPLVSWQPRTRNPARQFRSLVSHLLVQYEMPPFFHQVWLAGRGELAARHRRWFLHVAQGGNLRHCDLPLALTKRMAHHALRAPEEVTVSQALRWGQTLGLGGTPPLARAILGTRLGDHFEHEDFWITVIRWLVEHPLLDPAQVAPIIDYLHQQRFVPVPVLDRANGRLVNAPAQPNLQMRGRSPYGLLHQVDRWHRRLAHDNSQQVCQWEASGIKGFELLEGSARNDTLRCWTIRELLGSKALLAEGRALKHCVASYAASCTRGQCSIWTLESEDGQGVSKRLTIEVRSRQICQARGKANRLPTEQELALLRRWAARAGLTVSPYVVAR